jgi:hypothetical protein
MASPLPPASDSRVPPASRTGWAAALVFLVVGVPLFLRMPLWCDVTLYQVAARNILDGGVHYRDVFETNPPGFPLLLCAVRLLFGTSSEALRLVDLAIVGAIALGLLAWSRRAGATRAGVAWAAAAMAAFYPFIHEYNHVQRDVWMMLPALAAIALRLRRMTAAVSRPVLLGVLEGLLWGAGCWIKPQLLPVAGAVWLVATGRFASNRAAIRDFAAVFTGGVLAGLAGLGWLIESGSWPYFLDVWRNWNSSYAEIAYLELPAKVITQLDYFPPYSVFLLLAVPLALVDLRGRFSPDPARFHRAVLSATYLAWLSATLVLQRGFHYAHVPETLLMLAVFAAHRWPVPAAIVGIQVAAGIFLLVAADSPRLMELNRAGTRSSWVYRHFTERNSAFDPNRVRWWPGCFASEPSRELRRGVGMWVDHFGGLDPVELGAVADYLRTQGLRDGELIAWHDSTHVLYLGLGVAPKLRFMHVGTAYGLGHWQGEQVLRELQAALPGARFAVSDMHRVTRQYSRLGEVGTDGLPVVLPAWQREDFPFDQPVVFRSPAGRYLVHSIRKPAASCRMPVKLDQSEPPPP